MEQQKSYENYPIWIVIVSNLVSLATYSIGGFIIYHLGLLWLAVYLLYILILELKLLEGHCVDCYYFGKTCAFGKGRISSLLFHQGDSAKFCRNKMTWKDIIPDFLVSIVPIIVGIFLLIMQFDWLVLLAMVTIFLLGSIGSSLVRGQLACKYCKQKELGCPAQELFEKNKKPQ